MELRNRVAAPSNVSWRQQGRNGLRLQSSRPATPGRQGRRRNDSAQTPYRLPFPVAVDLEKPCSFGLAWFRWNGSPPPKQMQGKGFSLISIIGICTQTRHSWSAGLRPCHLFLYIVVFAGPLSSVEPWRLGGSWNDRAPASFIVDALFSSGLRRTANDRTGASQAANTPKLAFSFFFFQWIGPSVSLFPKSRVLLSPPAERNRPLIVA